ncbi:MAG TPA: hypothetical protein VFU48_05190 [Nitrospira sp.]|nr:hypothetical protein [Nitrospira sp.]
MVSSIVDLLETSLSITENVYLMGYEAVVWWILMVRVVLRRALQSARQRPIFEVEAIRQMPAGRSEYLRAIPVSIAAPLKQLVSRNRPSKQGRQRNLPGVISYPDDLLRFQARRLAVS